jgi:hypothetical protein
MWSSVRVCEKRRAQRRRGSILSQREALVVSNFET